jgi:hypothetical protein
MLIIDLVPLVTPMECWGTPGQAVKPAVEVVAEVYQAFMPDPHGLRALAHQQPYAYAAVGGGEPGAQQCRAGAPRPSGLCGPISRIV